MSLAPSVLVPQHFGSLVFDRNTSRYLPFDREVTALLVAAKERPLPEAASSLDPSRRALVDGLLDEFYPCGLFTPDLRFAGEVRALTPPDGHLAGPLALHLEVAAACNLACTHCFAGELPRRERALSLAELDELFATLSRVGCFRLGLTGGEPLLRKDLLDVIDLALGHGLHPCLTTNGLLLDEGLARELGRRSLVWINVSLDGATAATNDRTRGEGTFDRVVEKVRLLARHAKVTLAFTVLSHNAHEAPAFARLARDLGARTAVLRPLYPVGTAASDLSQMPTFAQYQRALDALAPEHAPRGIDPFGPHTRADAQARTFDNLGCGAGNTVCSVSLGGDVNPCSFLGPTFVGGNVREHGFEELWHRGETFRALREAPDDAFTGGCRARSMALAGSAWAPDPWIVEHQRAPQSTRHPLVVLDPRRRRVSA
ncbi:MAG: radical SAM protein [Polyangiales bacterium]